MYIKDLTDETVTELRATLTSQRDALAVAAVTGSGYEELQRLLESVAEAEARADTVANAVFLLSLPKMTNETLAFRLTYDLTTGADDRWSGRGNDIKRTYFDAKRDVTVRIVEKLLKDSDLI